MHTICVSITIELCEFTFDSTLEKMAEIYRVGYNFLLSHQDAVHVY